MAKVGATAVRTLEMKRQAWVLMRKGYDCPEIGEALGVSRQRAWQLLDEEVQAVNAENKDEAAQYRTRQRARHEARLRALQLVIDSPKSSQGDVISAIDKQTRIEVELAKLMGTNSPVKSELSGPGGEGLTMGVFAVPLGTVAPADWTAAALAQADGEEAEAERILGKRGSSETAPTG